MARIDMLYADRRISGAQIPQARLLPPQDLIRCAGFDAHCHQPTSMVLCEGNHDNGCVAYRRDCTQAHFRLPPNHDGMPDLGDEGVGVSSNLACHSKDGHAWCCVHQAVRQDQKLPCSAAGGKHEFVCLKFDKIPVIRRKDYGEVGMWAGLPAGYDRTEGRRPKEFAGIHVHCRKKKGVPKCIDSTFRAVRYIDEHDNEHLLTPPEAAALLYEREYGLSYRVGEVKCPNCATVQDDTLQSYPETGYVKNNYIRRLAGRLAGALRGCLPACVTSWLSSGQEALTHIPQRTQCQCCGSRVDRSAPIISNSLQSMSTPHKAAWVKKKLPDVKTADFDVQLYSSTAALLWTRGGKQVLGVHVHTYNKINRQRCEDETYGRVTVNGQVIDRNELLAEMFRATLYRSHEASESDHKMELLDD